MTRDRLAALRAKEAERDENVSERGNGEAVPLNINNECRTFMEEFFKQVDDIRSTINNITLKVSEVKRIHSAILSSHASSQANDKLKEELDTIMSNISSSSGVVRSKLKDIEKKIVDDEKNKFMNADFRIRKTQHAALSRKFIDLMTDYNECQVDYREKCKLRIKRQLEITGNPKSDNEVEDMLECEDLSVFTQGIMIQTDKAKQSLKDIEARHDDIIKLEKSIQQLHDMFVDIATLVESQGEMIDSIEFNVDQAQNYVESAKKQTYDAVNYQKKARKKKILIIICVVVTVIILVLIIGLSIGLR